MVLVGDASVFNLLFYLPVPDQIEYFQFTFNSDDSTEGKGFELRYNLKERERERVSKPDGTP